MRFEPGKVVEKFEVDGKQAVFRYPRKDDAKGLMKYINGLIRDKAYIGKQKPVTLQEEVKWLREVLRQVRKAEKIHIIVEMNGKIVGSSEAKPDVMDARRHTAGIAIGLSREAQDKGIGTKLLGTLIEQSKLLGIKILKLTVFGSNERARHVYERLGFKYVGKIPNGINHYGRYCDELHYYMEVPE
jgi:RimJ/RimL family protein N-acetyltransferase